MAWILEKHHLHAGALSSQAGIQEGFKESLDASAISRVFDEQNSCYR